MNNNIIDMSIDFLLKRGYKVPLEVLQMKSQKTNEEKLLIVQKIKEAKALEGYPAIRAQLWDSVYEAVYGYLTSNKQINTFKLPLSTAISAAYIYASEQAWTDAGNKLPLDEDTLAWAKSEIDAQLIYVDGLFETLKKLRKEGDFDAMSEAFNRASGYGKGLDSFYNYIKAAGAGGKMLTFVGSDGRESCTDCRNLKGKRKRASWWVSHDFVPPSRHFECGGYNCEHFLIDDNGNLFTI